MKNLTKRNKIVLAIAAVLVIAVIAVVAFSQLGGAQLSGTVAYPYFNPANANINVGGTVTLNVVGNPLTRPPQCTFTASSAVVTLSSPKPYFVVVTGVSGGSATITATCNVGTIAAHVTVLAPPTIAVSPDVGKTSTNIGVNELLTLCTYDASVQWDIARYGTPNDVNLLGSPYAPGCIVVEGAANGSADVRATNAAGQATVTVNVLNALTMSPAYPPAISVGQSITMSMAGADSYSTWSIFRGCESGPTNCKVRLSATTGHSVTITGQAPGAVIIACKRVPQGNMDDTGLTQVIVH